MTEEALALQRISPDLHSIGQTRSLLTLRHWPVLDAHKRRRL